MEEKKISENTQSEEKNSEKADGTGDSRDKKNVRYNRYYHGRRKPYYRYNQQQGESKKSEFKKLSIVIPLYNEEESLNPLTNEIRKALKPINISYEIIFVDDGSTD
ncbi:MAG TPA: glycosyltransferase, partial [Ignavibacteriaceae bacterium]|nr:glycosyltransferase [Ignavibacteriaceae bacterium]